MDDGSFGDIEMTLIKFDYQGCSPNRRKKSPAYFIVEFVQFSISMASIQLIKNYDCVQLRINLCSHSLKLIF